MKAVLVADAAPRILWQAVPTDHRFPTCMAPRASASLLRCSGSASPVEAPQPHSQPTQPRLRLPRPMDAAQSKALNSEVKSASTSFSLLSQLLQQHHAVMDQVHLSALCSGLANALPSPSAAKSAAVDRQAVNGSSTPLDCPSMELIMATLPALAIAAKRTIPAMQPRHISTIMWALGRIHACLRQELAPHPTSPVADELLDEQDLFSMGLIGAWPFLSQPGDSESTASLDGRRSSSTWASSTAASVNAAAGRKEALVGGGAERSTEEVLLRRLCATLPRASGRDIAQALYGYALIHAPCRSGLADSGSTTSMLAVPVRSALSPSALPPKLLHRMVQVLPDCYPQDLSMSLYALAMLRAAPPASFFVAFFSASQARLPSCSCQGLANIIWGLATLQQQQQEQQQRRKQQQQPQAQEQQQQQQQPRQGEGSGGRDEECASAPLQVPHSWLQAFTSASSDRMALFNSQELSLMAWALVKLQQHPGAAWMALLEREIGKRAALISAVDLSLTLASMKGLGHTFSPTLMRCIKEKAVKGARAAAGAEQALCSPSGQQHHAGAAAAPAPSSSRCNARQLLWQSQQREKSSAAMAGSVGAGDAQAQVLCLPSQLQPRIGPGEACNLLSQLAGMRTSGRPLVSGATPGAPAPPGAVLDALLADLTQSLPRLSAGELSSILHSLAELQHRPHRRWTGRLGQLLRSRLPCMRAEQLAGVLCSLARLGIRPEARWMDWAMLECERKLPGFGAKELGNVVWALARLGYRPPWRWLHAFFLQSIDLLPSFSMQELSMMVEAVSSSQLGPPQVWLSALKAELAARAEAWTPATRPNTSSSRGGSSSIAGSGGRVWRPAGRQRGSGREPAGSGEASLGHRELYSLLRASAVLDAQRDAAGRYWRLPVAARCDGDAAGDAGRGRQLLQAASMAGLMALGGAPARSASKARGGAGIDASGRAPVRYKISAEAVVRRNPLRMLPRPEARSVLEVLEFDEPGKRDEVETNARGNEGPLNRPGAYDLFKSRETR